MEWLEGALEAYGRVVHPPLVLMLCISGSIGHLVTIATLSAKAMLNPTNMLLISMSCSQLALCANFLYSTLFKWASDELCSPVFFSHYMAISMHISVTLSVLVHMSGVFHVVALSIIRYFSLARLTEINSSLPWFTYRKCQLTIFIIYISVLIVGVPLYFTTTVVEVPEKEECANRFPSLRNVSGYELSLTPNQQLQNVNFWLFHLAAKIIPSAILCCMTFAILDQLKKIRLMSARFSSIERDKQHQRTTNMILVIMFMFILVELPQGILAVISTIADIKLIYYLGDLNEMLTLLTSCVIFALFCSMNSRIRSAFRKAPCFAWIDSEFISRSRSRLSLQKSIEKKEKKDTLIGSTPAKKAQIRVDGKGEYAVL